MAHKLRTHTVLAEDLIQIPAPMSGSLQLPVPRAPEDPMFLTSIDSWTYNPDTDIHKLTHLVF